MSDFPLLDQTTFFEPPVFGLVGKGGGGKSLIAVLLASICRLRKIPIELYDGDPANPTLQRYFADHMGKDRVLVEPDQDSFVNWLEQGPFAQGRTNPSLVDFGANKEGPMLEWLMDCGATDAQFLRLIVPVGSIEGVNAASRIYKNREDSKMLMVFNEHGDGVEAAQADPRIVKMIEEGIPYATLPCFRRIAAYMSVKRKSPDIIAADFSDRFAAQGALAMLRQFDAMLEPFPEFRPW